MEPDFKGYILKKLDTLNEAKKKLMEDPRGQEHPDVINEIKLLEADINKWEFQRNMLE